MAAPFLQLSSSHRYPVQWGFSLQALVHLRAFLSYLFFCLINHLLWKFPLALAQPVGFPLCLPGRAHSCVYLGAISLAPSALVLSLYKARNSQACFGGSQGSSPSPKTYRPPTSLVPLGWARGRQATLGQAGASVWSCPQGICCVWEMHSVPSLSPE